jgi:hypothetical protein
MHLRKHRSGHNRISRRSQMNTQKQLKKLFAATALSAAVALSFSPVANADPHGHNSDTKNARQNVKQERKEVKEARKDVREQRKDVKDARRDLKKEKREDHRDYKSKDHRYDNNRGRTDNDWNRGRTDNDWNRRHTDNDRNRGRTDNDWNRGRTDNDWNRHRSDNDWNNRSDYRTYTGTVTRVNSNSQFQLRVGGQTYDVSANRRLPALSRGDVVRVYGVRTGGNDINNANVAIVNNR